MSSKLIFNKAVFGAILLISGTCIGAGTLGLPVQTAMLGLLPTILLLAAVWIVMSISALLMLEINLALPKYSNLISMANVTLGTIGKRVAWVVYLLFFYSLLAAYTSGGVAMIQQVIPLQQLIAITIFIIPLALIIYCGTRVADYSNRVLMLGVVITFGILIYLITSKFDLSLPAALTSEDIFASNSNLNIKSFLIALPIIVTSFGFHHLVPSIRSYLNCNVKQLRVAIIVGGLVPLVVYAIWLFLVFALAPATGTALDSTDALIMALSRGDNSILLAVACWGFFVLSTSFIGVSLGLLDFLADGTGLKKTAKNRAWLVLLTLLPPAVYTVLYPSGFLLALSYGGIFAAILLILYPALMVWYGRYSTTKVLKDEHYQVFGGKALLVIIIGFGLVVVAANCKYLL
ncbi:MAG: hypothetical protein COB50_03925 [Thiotrichales bacterium]|nr:MAG: hypothetical protein COB50_03925 [Thiotrichales bacterium]